MLREPPFLGPLALADIAGQGDVKPALALLELANADLDREHASILAPVARLERHRLAGTDAVP